ncbi:tetratricopeptide (TPR) repeat protein [Azospirillum lipoferum]|uniref:Tetratricopeptide repeat protein n=1 Tax=Azospirillum lipoferum TaxID=193 RepID=A0A5A9GS96_AZOLI|nr:MULTISPECIES: tetratricopeptide repeat protein [Azospirillum]KAA0597318.1 tetratricopeptide repeat protein [Azospirillum lipoferum]MCP1608845.1 tetratricopeptide (TPR) repeat protein [Azospirillum lipoferum]MDW5535840.1 tetratricopeptide repeat protein [Azospirillum sp. NL1]
MTDRSAHRRKRWLRGCAAAVALLAVPVLLSPMAADAASVPVRGGTHKDFGRLVFDWPGKVDFTAAVEGDRLVISFTEPIDAPLDRLVRALPDYLASGRVEADGKTVSFDLKRPVALKSFRNGNAVAIDLSPAAAGAASQQAAAAAKSESATPAPAPAKADSAKPVASAGRLRVQGTDQPDQSRLSFDWPAPVGYKVSRDGAAVTVAFEKGGTADLSALSKAPLRNIRNIESYRQPDGSLAVTLAVPQDAEVADSVSGKSMVLSVGNPGSRAGLPKSEGASSQGAPTGPGNAGGNAGASQGTSQPVPAKDVVKEGGKDAPTVASATSGRSAATANAAAATPAATPATPPAAAPPADVKAAPAVSADAKAQPAAGLKGPVLTFDTGGPASIAVYPRAGQLYIAFDRPMPIGAGKLSGPGSELMGAVEPVPATGGSVFRTKIGPMVWPTVERQGTTWRILSSARPANMGSAGDLRVEPDPDFLLGARLLVRAPDAANVVQFADPDVGDRIQVVPLPSPGQGVPEPHRYPDLEVMASYQGVVVRPISDNVTVRAIKEGVELTTAGGLHISPAADAGNPAVAPPPAQASAPPQAAPQPVPAQLAAAPVPVPPTGGASAAMEPPKAQPAQMQGRRLFNLPAWKRGDLDHFTEARQDLQLAVVNAPESERAKAQLDLARFYFANGFGQETLGLLDVLQQNQPDLEGWPEFRALRGAARVLTGDLDGGEADLSISALAGNPEANLWRAAIAADRRDWPKAMAGFKASGQILNSYPDPMLGKLGLRAAEAALETRDTATAKRLFDRVIEHGGPDQEENPQTQYLRGLLYAQTGEIDQARQQLTAAYNSYDRLYRAKAGLALTNLELSEGKMSPTAAAEQLAGLTFTWRGDDLEMQIRSRMGEVLIAGGEYAKGFNTMKETAALVADTPRAEAITKEMSRIFADLFKDGAQRLPTLDAMQLYDQFRELTPVGEAGDEIIRQLAERLISIDLLNRAADLLQHQVEYRLSGLDKARVGTRLASVRLLDNKPDEALKALELSNVAGLPADLAAERRLMQAKALAELNRGDEAMQLLAQDDSTNANLLRVDIAWKGQKWDAAALALNKVIGPPPSPGKPLDPNMSQLVLNRAVALALAGDGNGLNLLKKDFEGSMKGGPNEDAFRILTRPEQAMGLIDVGTIRSRVAEVDMFKKFLKQYRGGKQSADKPTS